MMRKRWKGGPGGVGRRRGGALKKEFTLVELLTVVGIIMILAGILLPGLYLAKERGRGSQCQSNMRQCMVAWTSYTVDNQGWVCPGRTKSPSWISASGTTTGFLTPYVDVNKILCPSFMILKPKGEYATNSGTVQYKDITVTLQSTAGIGYNCQYLSAWAYGSSSTTPEANGSAWGWIDWCNAADITTPSNTCAFADVMRYNGGAFQANSLLFPTSWQLGAFHGRHSSGFGNVAWTDGHVSRRKPVVLKSGDYGNLSGASTSSSMVWQYGAGDGSLREKYNMGDIDDDNDIATDECYKQNDNAKSMLADGPGTPSGG